MKTPLLLLAICFFLAPDQNAAESPSAWITGTPFIQGGVLFFKADTPVQGNTKGDVLLLGAPRQAANSLAILVKAADKHVKLRLFGTLEPRSVNIPSQKYRLPSIQFIVWKLHMPSDPDELPKSEKVIIPSDYKVPGYTVSPQTPAQ